MFSSKEEDNYNGKERKHEKKEKRRRKRKQHSRQERRKKLRSRQNESLLCETSRGTKKRVRERALRMLKHPGEGRCQSRWRRTSGIMLTAPTEGRKKEGTTKEKNRKEK